MGLGSDQPSTNVGVGVGIGDGIVNIDVEWPSLIESIVIVAANIGNLRGIRVNIDTKDVRPYADRNKRFTEVPRPLHTVLKPFVILSVLLLIKLCIRRALMDLLPKHIFTSEFLI